MFYNVKNNNFYQIISRFAAFFSTKNKNTVHTSNPVGNFKKVFIFISLFNMTWGAVKEALLSVLRVTFYLIIFYF